MELKNYNVYFFFIVLALVSMATFFIFEPFIIAILVASVLAVVFRPIYDFFLGKLGGRKGFSAILTSMVSLLVLIVPFLLILGLLVNELTSLYQGISSEEDIYGKYVNPIVREINDSPLLGALGLGDLLNREAIGNSISQIGQVSLNLLQAIYQSVIHFVFLTFVMFFSLYYLLVHGKEVVKKIMRLSPLRDSHEKLLIEKFVSISRAAIKGTLVVAFIQGFIGGLAFAIAGVPSATIWAVVMMILSLIPMFGSSIIWFPAGIILLLLGNIWQGIFILTVGLLIISLIDNVLRPELVGKDTQMHPLIVFFATLGGIALFGFLGFIIGPIIVALFLSLWDIYAVEFKKQLKSFNA